MNIGSKGKALIKHFEGCAHKMPNGTFRAYPDPASGGDPWTIGWGSTGNDINSKTVWTQQQCDDRFEKDVTAFATKVSKLVTAPTTQNQFDALVSFAYNLGLGNLAKSTLLKRHNAGNHDEAAEFLKWDKALGHIMHGLEVRRQAEADLYSS
jgi:lysozyme